MLNIDPFSGWVREIGNGGETALHLNGHGDVGDGDLTMGRGGMMRKERIVVSGDEIAMRIQRKMEYVAKCKTDGNGIYLRSPFRFTLFAE